jgi:Ca2+-binding EF-hand superfamily protein
MVLVEHQRGTEVLYLLTHPGEAFKVSELQSALSATSSRDVYALLCKKNNCRYIKAVASQFSDVPGAWNGPGSLDLSKTYVGRKGVIPIVEVCKLLPSLSSLILSNNFLTNESVWYICKVALFHPGLQELDLSFNAITWTAAMSVAELVTHNNRIHSVNLAGTSIAPQIVEAIRIQTIRNSASSGRRTRKTPNPCNHPITIRQRTLKRFFNDIAKGSGTVPSSALAEGLKEMWRISGREQEIAQCTSNFFELFNQRALSERIGWEPFMLLIMTESQYNRAFVDALKRVFDEFDTDALGFVEVRELKDMMEQADPHRTPPTAAELNARKSFYDLDDSMTLNWDEFLLLMYDHGPLMGTAMEFTKTPHPPVPRAYHN